MKKQLTTNNIAIPNKNLDILKKNFPHCFDKNGDFDFEKFKKELSKTEIDFSKESYGMDWLGKSYARLLASDEATTLLKEDEKFNQKQDKVNAEGRENALGQNKDSENLLIKGDNLEVLKHLSNAYYEKIKMIYIDPPYNTGSDGFVYQDDRKFTVEELSKLVGIDEEKAKRILEFTQSKSNSHSAWLTFMYPRLYIAKQLLKDDGVIFVSIDENEVAQLRILMDEIFGDDNFVGELIWKNKLGGANDTSIFVVEHEYMLCYSKNITHTNEFTLENKDNGKYLYEDKFVTERGKYALEALYRSSIQYSDSLFYGIECPDGTIIFPNESNKESNKHIWRWSKKTFNKKLKEGRVEFKKTKNGWRAYTKQYFLQDDDENERRLKVRSIIDFIGNRQGTEELKKYFDDKKIFTNPKPSKLIKYLLRISTNINDLVLDFFAGSGTTGDAVMQLNAEDGGNRKYILVQLPEKIDPKKNKTAYDFVKNELKVEEPTIFEITKERLIRAGKKIVKDNEEAKDKKDLSNVDFGFKIFETAPIWEDYDFKADEFDQQLKLFDESKLTVEDLKVLLITWKSYDGISLTQDLKEINLDGYTGYYFGTKLYLMNKGFKIKNLKKLLTEIDENKEFNPATVIVFGYNFESKVLREIAENIKNYANKKEIEVDFITRY